MNYSPNRSPKRETGKQESSESKGNHNNLSMSKISRRDTNNFPMFGNQGLFLPDQSPNYLTKNLLDTPGPRQHLTY